MMAWVTKPGDEDVAGPESLGEGIRGVDRVAIELASCHKRER